MFGLPPKDAMYAADLRAGRWLTPGDSNATVITQRLAQEKGWKVGDRLTLSESSGSEEDWLVVGITYDPLANAAVFVPIQALQRQLGEFGKANTLWLQTRSQDAAALNATAQALTAYFEARSFEVAPGGVFGYSTIMEIVERTSGGYSLILQLLAIMAVIIAVVGGVGLSGVLTLNVLERRREIGVMRSLGASSWRVIRLYIGEGVLLALLSWAIALPLSIPAAYGFATRGLSFALNQQLSYSFTPAGAVAWLLVVVVLAIVASAFPARSASRISVRESLAY
jgi:putative ABC transport system permease protein